MSYCGLLWAAVGYCGLLWAAVSSREDHRARKKQGIQLQEPLPTLALAETALAAYRKRMRKAAEGATQMECVGKVTAESI